MINCSMEGCEYLALFRCEKSHSTLKMCLEHKNQHNHECGYKQEEQKHSLIRLISYPNDLQNIHLVPFRNSTFIFSLSVIRIKIPADYTDALKQITNLFACKVLLIPTGQSERVMRKIYKYAIALKKTVFNLEIDKELLNREVVNIYNSYRSEIADLLCTGLQKLLSDAQSKLNMSPTGKKNLIFTVHLKEQQELFIGRYFNRTEINLIEMSKDFCETFQPFSKSQANISSIFQEFEKNLGVKQKEAYKKANMLIFNTVSKHWSELQYMRVAVKACEVPPENELIDIGSNSSYISCLFLTQENVSLHSVVVLSESELLFVLTFDNFSYIVHLIGNESKLMLVIPTNKVMIASGSTKRNVFIWHGKPDCVLYTLNEFALSFDRIVNIGLETHELLTGLVFIEEQARVVFTTQSGLLNSCIVDCPRVKISLGLQNEIPICLVYNHQLKLIFLKTLSFIKVFSSYLQFLYETEKEGSNFEVTSISSNGIICSMFSEYDLMIFYLQMSLQLPDQDKKRYQLVGNCQKCLSKDMHELLETNKSDPYIPYHSRNFQVPDFLIDFEFLKI